MMKRIIWTCVLGLVTAFLTGTLIAAEATSPKAEQLSTATLLSPAQSLTDFSLLDTAGKPFTQSSLKNHWSILFFGYAQCPKICPETLAIVTEAWRALPEQNKQFVFVSIDPKADTPNVLKQFLEKFNPSFIGLTGDETQIKKLAQACRIYSWTDQNTNASGQRMIDHSATLLLINPQGQIQALFSPPHNAGTLARELKILMAS